MADGKVWTTRNLDVAVDPSYCYDGRDDNCRRYGRLYTWASAQRACATLGQGWRLPSNGEWRELGRRCGGIRQDPADLGRAAFDAIKEGGPSKFEAVFGGGRDPDGTYARADGEKAGAFSVRCARDRSVLAQRPRRIEPRGTCGGHRGRDEARGNDDDDSAGVGDRIQ